MYTLQKKRKISSSVFCLISQYKYLNSLKSMHICLRRKMKIWRLVFWENEQNEVSLCLKQEQMSVSKTLNEVFLSPLTGFCLSQTILFIWCHLASFFLFCLFFILSRIFGHIFFFFFVKLILKLMLQTLNARCLHLETILTHWVPFNLFLKISLLGFKKSEHFPS